MPLRHATIEDLATSPGPIWPTPPALRAWPREAKALHENTPYAIVALGYLTTYDHVQLLRGLDTWLTDLAADPEFAHAILRKVTDLMIAGLEKYLDAVGPYIDLITLSDDLGSQRAPLISPRMYRRMVKPYQAEIIAVIKKRSKAKVFFHSCGNVYPLIGDLSRSGWTC